MNKSDAELAIAQRERGNGSVIEINVALRRNSFPKS